MKSSKDLVNQFNAAKIAGQPTTPGRFAKIAHGHPSIQRPARLDLVSHNLTDLTVQVGSRSYSLCDISSSGFSYAQHIPIKSGALKAEVARVNNSGATLHGKVVPISFYYRGDKNGETLQIFGRICNHRLFLGLNVAEVSKELKETLFQSRIPKDDPLHRYAKANALLDAARKQQYSNKSSMASLLAINISLINFFEEMGATKADFERLWNGYEQRPLFVKYGVAIDNPEEAQKLSEFARLHAQYKAPPAHSLSDSTPEHVISSLETAPQLEQTKRKLKPSEIAMAQARRAGKSPYLPTLADQFNASDLLNRSWELALAHFKLDQEIQMPLPFLEPLSSNLRMEMVEVSLEEIFDGDFRKKEVICHEFLLGIFLEMESIKVEKEELSQLIYQFMQASFDEMLKQTGWPG